MAASEFENPRRDQRWDESKVQDKPDETGRGSYGDTSGGRASGSQRYGYAHQPMYRTPSEGGFDEHAFAPDGRRADPGRAPSREEHGAYRHDPADRPDRPDRLDPSHRFDPDYHEWRAEQMRQLDKDYALWRQERYRKFAEEFETWRRQRFSGEHRPGARSTASGFRGPTSGNANAAGALADSPVAEPGALRPRPDKAERSDLPERSDRGADRFDKADRPEKSGGILSGLLGTGSSRK